MKKLNIFFKEIYKSNLFIIVFTAIVTSTFNFLYFSFQQSNIKKEKLFEAKSEVLNKLNSLYIDLVKFEHDATFLDFEFDVLYKVYADSLKISALPFRIHEEMKSQLYSTHKELAQNVERYTEANLEFYTQAFLSTIYFESEEFIDKFIQVQQMGGVQKRRNKYEYFRDKIYPNTQYHEMNPYPIADSMQNYTSKIYGEFIVAMTSEIMDFR